MGIFLTQEEVLNRFKNKHGNKYDYSKVVFIGIKNKVEIICQTHGSFFQNPNKHYNWQGCPKCIGKNMSNNDFIERCNKKHKNKYDYSKTNFIRNIDKIKIICPIHGEFEQVASAHLHGNGCIKCAGVERKSTQDFIKRAKEVHGDKYDYSLVNYTTCKDKVKIICGNHGVFEQSAISHLKGHICKKCSLENRMTTNDFINKSNIKHNYK